MSYAEDTDLKYIFKIIRKTNTAYRIAIKYKRTYTFLYMLVS